MLMPFRSAIWSTRVSNMIQMGRSGTVEVMLFVRSPQGSCCTPRLSQSSFGCLALRALKVTARNFAVWGKKSKILLDTNSIIFIQEKALAQYSPIRKLLSIPPHSHIPEQLSETLNSYPSFYFLLRISPASLIASSAVPQSRSTPQAIIKLSTKPSPNSSTDIPSLSRSLPSPSLEVSNSA
jgi:hypothetical protein